MASKKYRVVLVKNAIKTLKEIYDYYQGHSSSGLARKIRNALLEESKTLSSFPDSKAKLPAKKQVLPPFRYTKKWSFKIIFQVFENDNTVVVLDFLHDKENPEKWEGL